MLHNAASKFQNTHSSSLGTFTQFVLLLNAGLHKFERIKILQRIPPDHTAVQVEVNSKITRKYHVFGN